MATTRHEVGWKLVGYSAAVLVALAAALLAIYGTESAGVRVIIRATARISVVLFCAAFAASSLARRWPSPATRWLLLNRRYVGVSFALSHALHLAAILTLLRIDPDFHISVATAIGGGLAYVFIFAMAATSFDRAAAWLGPVAWRRLHKMGGYYIWVIFFQSYAPRAAIESIWYLPLVFLLVTVLGLRLTSSHVRRRSAVAVSSFS